MLNSQEQVKLDLLGRANIATEHDNTYKWEFSSISVWKMCNSALFIVLHLSKVAVPHFFLHLKTYTTAHRHGHIMRQRPLAYTYGLPTPAT